MPRIAKGKQSFRIVYFFLCDKCRNKVTAYAAAIEGKIPRTDPAWNDLEGICLKKTGVIIGDLLPLLCPQCREGTLNKLGILGVIGKLITVPNLNRIIELEVLVQNLYGAVATRLGVAPEKVVTHLLQHFYDDYDSDSKNIFQRLIKEFPYIQGLIKLKLDGKQMNSRFVGYINAMSGLQNQISAEVNDFIMEKIRPHIMPYGYKEKDLSWLSVVEKKQIKKSK